MGRTVLSLVGALAILAVLAGPALGVTLSDGEKEAKFSDWSNLYFDHDANPLTPMLPRALSGAAPVVGDENRALIQTTTIKDVSTNLPEFTLADPDELTGLMYDLVLIAVVPLPAVSPLAFQLDFAPLGRNPLTPSGGLLPGTGGVVEIYNDIPQDFTPDPGGVGRLDVGTGMPLVPPGVAPPIPIPAGGGPTFWTEGQPLLRDSYPGATDGSLWLSGAFVDFAQLGILGHAPGTVLTETIDLTTGVGSGSGILHIYGGSFFGGIPGIVAGLWGTTAGADGIPGNADDVSLDMTINFDLSTPRTDPGPDGIFGTADDTLVDVPGYSGLGYWQIDSEDPASFGVIVPEPATLGLLGTGLLGLFAFRRRRRTRK
jgi:hypothetical protein